MKPIPGSALTLQVNQGHFLSSISTPDVVGHSPGIVFDTGSVKFTTTAPVGGSQAVSLMYDQFPSSPLLFLVGADDSLTPIPANLWTLAGAMMINVNLTDGDPVTDQDGVADGSITATLAIGSYDSDACIGPVTARAKSGKVQLSWSPVAGAASYDVLRGTSGDDAGLSLLAEDHVDTYVTYLDEQVTNEVTYSYRVVPKDAEGNGLCASSLVSVTPTATRSR